MSECGPWGVKVPSTSSLSVYTKVLAHNLNDITNWASLISLLLRICWCLLSIFLIYCSDEWKKLVNLIYCFQVLFRMNFKIVYFLMKILGNTPSPDSAASRDFLSSQNSTWGIVFFSPHFIDDTLNTRAECVRDPLICRKYMFLAKYLHWGLWEFSWYHHPMGLWLFVCLKIRFDFDCTVIMLCV